MISKDLYAFSLQLILSYVISRSNGSNEYLYQGLNSMAISMSFAHFFVTPVPFAIDYLHRLCQYVG